METDYEFPGPAEEEIQQPVARFTIELDSDKTQTMVVPVYANPEVGFRAGIKFGNIDAVGTDPDDAHSAVLNALDDLDKKTKGEQMWFVKY